MRGFREKFGIPQCAGSIDGSHIQTTQTIITGRGGSSCGPQLPFQRPLHWVAHDARVLVNSAFYKKVTGGELLQGEEVQLQGQTLGTFLIGDSAYPLLPWLVKPFSFFSSLNSQQKKFNYKLSQARVVVEIAFGRLKARWRRLSKQIDIHIDNVPHIIAACCVLHNVCEIHHDGFNEEWLQEFEVESDQPENGT